MTGGEVFWSMSTSAVSESTSVLRSTNSAEPWSGITVVETRIDAFALAAGWRPAVNAYRCTDKFVIYVDAAGVPLDAVEVRAEARRVSIHGSRVPPAPGCKASDLNQLLALEIDYGTFERVLDLPQDVDPARMIVDTRHGLLRIQLPLAG